MVVLVDEIYARISYVPVGRWLRAAPDLADRSLIVDGVSKAYAMTGWRLGWLVGPQPLMDAVFAVQSHLSSHPSSITQRAALFALLERPGRRGNGGRHGRDVPRAPRRHRERPVGSIDGLECSVPDGAFYVFPDVRGLFGRPLGPNGRVVDSAAELCAYLLDEALVTVVPGEAFGTPGFVRLSYALAMDQLHEGVERIQERAAAAARLRRSSQPRLNRRLTRRRVCKR